MEVSDGEVRESVNWLQLIAVGFHDLKNIVFKTFFSYFFTLFFCSLFCIFVNYRSHTIYNFDVTKVFSRTYTKIFIELIIVITVIFEFFPLLYFSVFDVTLINVSFSDRSQGLRLRIKWTFLIILIFCWWLYWL